MSENKQNSKVEQAKQKAGALYEKGNELMDKVSFLKNPRNKKIAWGVLGAICLLLVFLIVGMFCGGGKGGGGKDGKDDSTSLGDVTTTGNVTAEDRRGAEILNKLCKMFLQSQYGEAALKSYEFRELKWNESRAILKADVSIHKQAPITEPGGDVDIDGTAVFYLEDAGDDINVVDLQFQ